MELRFRVLGSLEVEGDGSRLDLGTPKQRALLAFLLVHLGEVVSVDRLVEALWGDDPPARAEVSVRSYVSNLRRILDPDRPPGVESSVLVTRPPGYVLCADRSQVDATRFEDLAAHGHDLLDSGAAQDAAAVLADALALWRGPAYAEFVYDELGAAEATRLEELRLVAFEDRMVAELACGRHGRAVAELEGALARHPLRERTRALLATALYRAGRQADALRVIQDGRAVLAEELGVDPGPELAQLERDILDHAPALLGPPGPSVEAPGPSGPEMAVSPQAVPAPLLPLLGREAEMSRLDQALREAVEGSGRAVAVTGEPGIGKTRLVEELAGRAAALGAAVAWGRCDEGEAVPAFWPLRQLVRRLDVDGDSDLRRCLDDFRPDLGPLLAPVGSVPAPDPSRHVLAFGLAGFLTGASRSRPLVLVIDDLQWADTASLRLLQQLAGELPRSRVLLVLACRDVESAPPALEELFAELARRSETVRVELRGLDVDAVVDYVAAVAGRDAVGDLGALRRVAVAVQVRTGGNPLYVRELVRLLASEGPLDGRAADEAERVVPPSVRDVIRQRVARLPESTQTVLETAAIVGRDVGVDVLQRTCDLEPDVLLDAVDALVTTGFLVDDPERIGRFRFAHALVAETISGRLPPLRRARLHALVAGALEDLSAGDPDRRLSELAWHYGRAVAGGLVHLGPTAFDHAVRAAERADEQLAYEDAAAAWDLARSMLDHARPGDRRARYDVLRKLGRARQLAGDNPGAQAVLHEAIDVAEALGDSVAMAEAAVSLSPPGVWRSTDYGDVDRRTIDVLERVLEQLDPADSRLRALVLGALAAELSYADVPDRCDELSRAAVEMARRLDDTELRALVLNARYLAIWRPATFEERMAVAEELVSLPDVGSVPGQFELLGRFLRLNSCLEAGDLTAANAELDRCEHLAERLRARTATIQLLWARAVLQLLAGDLDVAEQVAAHAYRLHSRVRVYGFEVGRVTHATVRDLHRGATERVSEDLRALLSAPDPMAALYTEMLARCLLDQGREDEARRLVAASGDAPLGDDWAWFVAVCFRAEVRAELGDRDSAARVLEELAPYSGRLAVPGIGFPVMGAVDRYLGLLELALGRLDDAERHLRAALTLNERIRARGWVARTWFDLGRLLVARAGPGDLAAGGAALDAAEAIAVDVGMDGLRRRIETARVAARDGSTRST